MNEELKPCPFCGGSDLTILPNEQDHAHVHCNDCMAKGPVVDQVGDWTRPHTAWNRRAEQSDNSALRADVERLSARGPIDWRDGPPPDDLKDGRKVLIHGAGDEPAIMYWLPDTSTWNDYFHSLQEFEIARHCPVTP